MRRDKPELSIHPSIPSTPVTSEQKHWGNSRQLVSAKNVRMLVCIISGMPCHANAGAMVNQFLSRVSWDLGFQEAEGWGQQVPKFFKIPLHKLSDEFRHM